MLGKRGAAIILGLLLLGTEPADQDVGGPWDEQVFGVPVDVDVGGFTFFGPFLVDGHGTDLMYVK